MALNVWIFEFVHGCEGNPTGDDVTSQFEFYLDMWTRDEQRGIDGVMLSEHHFSAGYAPSPNLLLAALAQRTTRMRLGVLGSVSSYATPWRVAEEFAMLHHLTRGRMEMGLVSGIPPELANVGVSPEDMATRHAEICDVLDAARAMKGPISHHGTHWSFSNLDLTMPFPKPDLPVWTACRTPESSARAGARGWNVCVGFSSVDALAANTDSYRRAAAAAGRSVGLENIALRRIVSIVDRPDQVQAGVMRGKQGLKKVVGATPNGLPPEVLAALFDRPEGNDFVHNDEYVAGTPDQVAAALLDQTSRIGAGQLMVLFPEVDRAGQERAHARFCDEVLPLLRQG